jgi:hypothetical protein
MISRSSFDEMTLSALDDVARLLHVNKSARGMNETFKNGGERGLDAVAAKPAATTILKSTRAAAAGLMKAAFGRDPEAFELARQRHLPRLRRALDCAVELSLQERQAIPEVGEQGVFRQHVEIPLRAITQTWAASA